MRVNAVVVVRSLLGDRVADLTMPLDREFLEAVIRWNDGHATGPVEIALALHVIDEASTGFLDVDNPTVRALHERLGQRFRRPPAKSRKNPQPRSSSPSPPVLSSGRPLRVGDCRAIRPC